MTTAVTPHLARIAGLRRALAGAGMDLALLWQSRDLLYYTGASEPGMLAVWAGGARLLVRGSLERVAQASGLPAESLTPERDYGRIFASAREMAGLGERAVVGGELDLTPVNWHRQWQALMPGWEWRDATPLVLDQRMVKDPGEIQAMAHACAVAEAGHRAAFAALAEGVSELDLAAAAEDAQRRAGHEGEFFMRLPDFFMARGMVASGDGFSDNTGVALSITGRGLSPAVPAGPSRRPVKRGQPVLLDIPAQVGGYHADFARSYLVGRPDDALLRADEILGQLFAVMAQVIRPGLTWADCYRQAFAEAKRLGAGDGFQALPGGRVLPYIGHGVGLELNEPPLVGPRNQGPVRAGVVLAMEMHLLLDHGRGLKFEDMLLVGEDGGRYLSTIPRRLLCKEP